MAITGNGNSTLVLHLEKIAYGVCGAVALIALLIPLFSGKQADNLQAEVAGNRGSVLEREREAIVIPKVPQLRAIIEEQWKVPEAPPPYPEWTTERIPSVIKWTKAPPEEFVVHKPARVERLEYHRHSERLQPYLRVIGKFGELTHGVFRDVKLLRRKGEEGEFVEVRDFSSSQALLAQAVEYDDFDVESGAVYAYRIRTEAAKAPDAAENVKDILPAELFKDSEPCGITRPVPYDFALNIINAEGFNAANQQAGYFFGDIILANYADEKGAPEKISNNKFEEGFEFGPVRSGRKIFSVQRCENQVVTIRDLRNLSVKHIIKSSDPKRSVELPPPVDCGAPEPSASPEGESPGAGAQPVPAAGQPEPAAGAPEPPGGSPPAGDSPEKKKEGPKKAKDKDKDKDKKKPGGRFK